MSSDRKKKKTKHINREFHYKNVLKGPIKFGEICYSQVRPGFGGNFIKIMMVGYKIQLKENNISSNKILFFFQIIPNFGPDSLVHYTQSYMSSPYIPSFIR